MIDLSGFSILFVTKYFLLLVLMKNCTLNTEQVRAVKGSGFL